MRKRGFNGLTPKEWATYCMSVLDERHLKLIGRREIHKLHGATFPIELSDRLIKMYSKKKDWILDTFVGTGTTLLSCRKLQRNGIGFELYSKFFELIKTRLKQQNLDYLISKDLESQILYYNEDCRDLGEYIDNQIQFHLT